ASATLGSAGLTKWCAEVEAAGLIVSGFPVQTRRSQPFLQEGGARRIVQIHRRRILHPRLRTAFRRMSIALYVMPLPSAGFLVPTRVLGARPKPILWPETGLVAVIAGRVRGGFEQLDRVNRRTRLA